MINWLTSWIRSLILCSEVALEIRYLFTDLVWPAESRRVKSRPPFTQRTPSSKQWRIWFRIAISNLATSYSGKTWGFQWEATQPLLLLIFSYTTMSLLGSVLSRSVTSGDQAMWGTGARAPADFHKSGGAIRLGAPKWVKMQFLYIWKVWIDNIFRPHNAGGPPIFSHSILCPLPDADFIW